MNLEERIHCMQGHLIEFMSKEAINTLELNSALKAKYIAEREKFNLERLNMLTKVIFLYDLCQFLKGVHQDNMQRSAHDQTRVFKIDGKNVEMSFPRGDLFYKEGYSNPMYGLNKLDEKGVKEDVNQFKGIYLRALLFWEQNT